MSVLARVPTSSLEPLDSADEGPGRCTQEAHGKAHCAVQNARESESMKTRRHAWSRLSGNPPSGTVSNFLLSIGIESRASHLNSTHALQSS